MNENDIPKAQAILKKGKDNYLWVITECPICGRKNDHQHDGGPFSGDPLEYLGHRAARCISIPKKQLHRGYNLVEADHSLTIKTLKE